MLRVFIGWDKRQPISYQVLHHSIVSRATAPISITPLIIDQLPIKRKGLTDFTWSRFLVPYLCGFEGVGVFLDADMLCLDDLSAFETFFGQDAVKVSKNQHKFEWASFIQFNCAHPHNRILTPEYVEKANGLHQINWTDQVGSIDPMWNFLAGYDTPTDQQPKLVHYTQGLPIYPETDGTPYADLWRAEHRAMNFAEPWQVLMGNSVHAAPTADGRLVAKLHRDAVAR